MRRRPHDQDGFTLLGLLVLVAAINIGLAVAATSWVTIGRRADEAELIWRGQQYIRALNCHQEQTGGLPDDLAELLESVCIRALYPEPMSIDGEWRILRESDMRELQSSRAGPGAQDGFAQMTIMELDARRGGGSPEAPGNRRTGRGAVAGAGRSGLQGDAFRQSFDRFRALSESLRSRFSSDDRIVGVMSTATGEALRVYEGESTYENWRFVAGR